MNRIKPSILGSAIGVVLLVMLAVAGPAAAANNTTSYYENESTNTTGAGWVPGENATLDNILDMATRLGPTFIGTGGMDPSGTGYVGYLILSLVLVGSTLGTMRGAGVGPVGGSIIGMTLAYGLVDVGLAPSWVKTILLLGLGLATAVVIKRTIR